VKARSQARLRSPQAIVLAAVLMAGLLLGSALLIHSTVKGASELTVRGLGEALVLAMEDAFWAGAEWPPTDESLEELLVARAEDGLRYVALVSTRGELLASAGEPLGKGMREGSVERIDRRARVVDRIRPPRRPRAFRRPPPTGQGPLVRRGPPLIIYEFEPLPALALEAHSRRLLVIAFAASLGILALAFAFARSLGQREALQGELERGRRLASLGSMSAVLAHELRNPLASLKGHAQLLAEDVEQNEALRPRVGRVVAEAVRLERLMDDLLTFVRSGELHRAPVEPDEVLRAAVASVGSQGVQVHPLGGPGRWSLDAPRVQQALENVLRNARQASPDGAPIDAFVERAGATVVFRVRDRGPGIPPGDEERIFEPFVTGRIKGVGLGLPITRRIVELHGGTVTAHNVPDGGAEFRLAFPGKEG
jgi:two-component system, NtrC family, sensor histidine kinase HydH